MKVVEPIKKEEDEYASEEEEETPRVG